LTRTFVCRGPLDLMTKQMDEILAFCAGVSDGAISRIAENRSFADICTANWDALKHFLLGQDAWNKLSSETAHAEFKSALENDPDFALARLRLAEVKVFRGDRDEARIESRTALTKPNRLIEFDQGPHGPVGRQAERGEIVSHAPDRGLSPQERIPL
jgi:hypothetical protein